jgi:ribosomal protein L29
MKKEELNSILSEIASMKKELLISRIKASSGESPKSNDYKEKKKKIARLFTKINDKKLA